MSSMTFSEKQFFERLFEMGGGYLLDFSNSSLQEFMNDYEIDLGNNKYDKYGSSKAKRMRVLWEIEPDEVVAPILSGLVDYAAVKFDIGTKQLESAHKYIDRLYGRQQSSGEEALTPSQESVINARIWNNGKCRIFLSHKSQYKVQTAKLKDDLKLFGASCFVAHEDIEPTRSWQDEIENALHSMDVLVALMTDGFKESDWTDQEIGFAMGRKVPVVAVRMGTDPYGFIGKYQGAATNWDNATQDVLRILMGYEAMVDGYIESMSSCRSFDMGNKLAVCLPYLRTISAAQEKTIVEVFNSNDELRGSFGFNGGKSALYGEGLAYHLSRITGSSYILNHEYKMEKE